VRVRMCVCESVCVCVGGGGVRGVLHLGDGVALLSRAFCFTGGVAQGEDDGPLVERRHGLDNVLCEGSRSGRHSCRTTWHTGSTGSTCQELVVTEAILCSGQFITLRLALGWHFMLLQNCFYCMLIRYIDTNGEGGSSSGGRVVVCQPEGCWFDPRAPRKVDGSAS